MDKEKKKTSWGKLWTKKYPWIKKASEHSAYYTYFKTTFRTDNKGDGAITEHAKGKYHKLRAGEVQ